MTKCCNMLISFHLEVVILQRVCSIALPPIAIQFSFHLFGCCQSNSQNACNQWCWALQGCGASLCGKLGHYLKLMGQTQEVEMTQYRVQMLAITSGSSHRLIKESSHWCHWWTVMTDICLIGFICWSSSWNFEQRVKKNIYFIDLLCTQTRCAVNVSERHTHAYIYTYNIFCTRFVSEF